MQTNSGLQHGTKWPRRFGLLLGALALVILPASRAQTDNFNAGNDASWSHLDLNTYIPGIASYTFPADGNGGKAYHLQTAATPAPYVSQLGPGRILSYRADVTYTGRFTMGVDLLAWNNTIDQAFGPFWYAQNIALGAVTGYVLTYDPFVNQLLISRITNEQRSTLAQVNGVLLDPASRYRFVVSSHDGSTFLAQIFSTADTNNPVYATIAQDFGYASGYGALLVFDGSDLADSGADATFDNYSASVPAANAMRPVVAMLNPMPGGKAPELYPTVTAGILDRDTGVDTTKILLWFDGNRVADTNVTITPGVQLPGNPGSFSGAMVTYPISTLLPAGSLHTNRVAYADYNGAWTTNVWTWTTAYPFLRASNSLPVSAGGDAGFAVRLVRATSTPILPNSIDTAESQLATPPGIAAVFSTNFAAVKINFTKDVTVDPAGVFPYDSSFPGIDPADCVNVAMEATAWLQLPAGVSQFGVKSDDGFKLTSGTSMADLAGVQLGYHSGGTYSGTFQFVTEAAGLYPVRFVFNQSGGGAYVQLYSVDPVSSLPILINDTASGGVKAFRNFTVLESATTLAPPAFAVDNSAVIDRNARTITVPTSSAQRFYRIRTVGAAPRITSIRQSAGNVVLSYQ